MYIGGMASLDPQSTIFGLLSLGGLAMVLRSLGTLRDELKRMILESDNFRQRVAEIGEELHRSDDFRQRVRAVVDESCLGALRADVKALKIANRIPETTAIPRERLDA